MKQRGRWQSLAARWNLKLAWFSSASHWLQWAPCDLKNSKICRWMRCQFTARLSPTNSSSLTQLYLRFDEQFRGLWQVPRRDVQNTAFSCCSLIKISGCTSSTGGVYVPCIYESYRRRLRSLLYLCYIFRALINSLVWWFCSLIVSAKRYLALA